MWFLYDFSLGVVCCLLEHLYLCEWTTDLLKITSFKRRKNKHILLYDSFVKEHCERKTEQLVGCGDVKNGQNSIKRGWAHQYVRSRFNKMYNTV